MNKVNRNFAVGGVVVSLLISGCATQQGTDQLGGAGIGALIGGVLGCGIGAISGGKGGCAKGAAIGAATGLIAGWSAVKISQYQADKVRSAQADLKLYGLTKAVDSTQVKIKKGISTPSTVKAGQSVNVTTDYSLMLPPNIPNTMVEETLTLKKDNEVLATLPQPPAQRSAGGWAAHATLPIPSDAAAGTYIVQHKVQAGTSYDTDDSVFVVAK